MKNIRSRDELQIIVNRLFKGEFKRNPHISYNYHYAGYSEVYEKRIFVKIFDKKYTHKYEKEVFITQSSTSYYVDHFEKGQFCFLILDEVDFQDFSPEEFLSRRNLAKIARRIATFHNNNEVKKLTVKPEISERIENTLEKLKNRDNYLEIRQVWEQMKEFKEIANLESELYEKVVIHGDFGARNIKKSKHEPILIDFERSKEDIFYLDFIKFFYIDLKQNKQLKDFFLKEYYRICETQEISKILESFFVFYTGLGIMKYTMDFEDKEFEQVGHKMIDDTKCFWEKKNLLKALLLFSLGDSLGTATTHYSSKDVEKIYGRSLTSHSQKINRDGTVSFKWRKAEVTDDTHQMLAVAEMIVRNRRIDREEIFGALQSLDDRYRKKSTATGKALMKNDVQFVAYKGNGNGILAQCLPIMLTHGQIGWECADYSRLIENTYKIATITHGNCEAICCSVFLNMYVSSITNKSNNCENTLEDIIILFEKFCRDYGTRDIIEKILCGFLLSPNSLLRYWNKDEEGNFGFSAQESVPYIISCSRESNNLKDVFINALNRGGDCDSILAVLGFIRGMENDDISDTKEWFSEYIKVNTRIYKCLINVYTELCDGWREDA